MQSDAFQSGPPDNGNSDAESPTIRATPPTPGTASTPPGQPLGASNQPYGQQQPNGFTPTPQPGFGAPPQFPPEAQFQPPSGALAQPPAGPGSAPQFPPPPFGTLSPQGFPPQQPAFGAPPQPGVVPPIQPGYSGPPPGYSGPPPGYSGPPPGYGQPAQGFPPGYPPQQPGFPPGGPIAPQRRRGRGGLIAITSIIVVIVLIVGVVAVLALARPKPAGSTGTNTPASTPTVSAPTPTVIVPAGFQRYTSSLFSIEYPTGWTMQAPDGNTGENFTGPLGQTFQVLVQSGADAAAVPTVLDSVCKVFGDPVGSVKTVTIGGQQWQQESCGQNGSADGTDDATFFQGQLFSIDYFSIASDFNSDKTQYFGTMEQSFTFGS